MPDGRTQALLTARHTFADDLRSISIVELDEATCESAASIAEATGVQTLDALHPRPRSGSPSPG